MKVLLITLALAAHAVEPVEVPADGAGAAPGGASAAEASGAAEANGAAGASGAAEASGAAAVPGEALPGAEGAGEIQMIPGLPPGPPPPADQVDEIAYVVGLGLRCPVCQGLSVADSTAAAAVNMQRRIRELVAVGYTKEQIDDYFVDRYGEWILLDPKRQGLNWLLVLFPGLATGMGLVWAMSLVAQWRKEPEDPVPLPSDKGLVPKDKYEERLLAELDE